MNKCRVANRWATWRLCLRRCDATEISGQLTARMIDEFPVFAVAATQAAGTTVVRDAEESAGEGEQSAGRVGE